MIFGGKVSSFVSGSVPSKGADTRNSKDICFRQKRRKLFLSGYFPEIAFLLWGNPIILPDETEQVIDKICPFAYGDIREDPNRKMVLHIF